MAENNQQQFVQLVVEPEFEITTTQPWRIRRIADGFEPSINQSPEGYMQVGLNRHTYGIHRLVALQFIPNDDPEHKTQCDHVSRIRTDNSLGNLRWITPSQNSLNRQQHLSIANYVYVDDIDDESIVVNEYGNYQFENLYFNNDIFYFFNGLKFKQLYIYEAKGGYHFVYATDINGKRRRIQYTKFKKLVGLI
ncbi:MAG: hypothetical protein EZS28_052037 [Streblomastix strix]|uniref:HNH nuclease domain-containing protein n=1 Tax=Streblomastix strix TaxID=222440 RepID=A0A5J4SN22_9EUKA|nr:MAG: hypothetical protein EZS28_052037 [Streblomastix strix]